MTFNNRLSWKDHIASILQSVSKLLHGMCKLSKDIDRKSLESIYQTFIRPKLEYACIVWDDCSEQDCQAVENCQLRAARKVTGAKRGTSHETQWPNLDARKDHFKLCFMHKVVNKAAPDYVVEILPNTVTTHYNLRDNDDFDQYQFTTEKLRKSLFPDCIRKWNGLDKIVRNDQSYNSLFKIR
mgnify:CR=1 FL=1